MATAYYTYRISVDNKTTVKITKRDPNQNELGNPEGKLKINKSQEFRTYLKQSENQELTEQQIKELGEKLFNILFDQVLLVDFSNFYSDVKKQQGILRIELDINVPELAALPWEFMRLPEEAHLGTMWLGTDPKLVLSRWRSQWNPAEPIQLKNDEKLRIALAISAPADLGKVVYQNVKEALEALVSQLPGKVELLPIVESANAKKIDEILQKKPHIFHFIGHGRLKNEQNQDIGEIASVDQNTDGAEWVNADYFSNLFKVHQPGIVMLQVCESGKLSPSQEFTGIASELVEQNIPVVIAMQYQVTNRTAIEFAKYVYAGLTQGKSVDLAVQDGRRAITLTQGYKTRDFATPVIFMRVADANLFNNPPPNPTTPSEEIIQNITDFWSIVDLFINRKVILFLGPGINRQFYLELQSQLAQETRITNLVGLPCQFCPYLPDKRPDNSGAGCPMLTEIKPDSLLKEQELATASLNIRYFCQYKYQKSKDRYPEDEDKAQDEFYSKLRGIIKSIVSKRETNHKKTGQKQDIHDILAQLPCPVILTTNYDDLLEQALKRGKQDYCQIYYIADGQGQYEYRYQNNRSKVKRSQQLPIFDPDSSTSSQPIPIIVKLFGTIDNRFVITQNQLNFFAAFSRIQTLPNSLMKLLTGTDSDKFIILFLGYSPTDTELELIINRLWKQKQKSLAGSYLIHRSKPGELERKIWQDRGVNLIQIDSTLEEFMVTLKEGIESRIEKGN